VISNSTDLMFDFPFWGKSAGKSQENITLSKMVVKIVKSISFENRSVSRNLIAYTSDSDVENPHISAKQFQSF